MAEAKRMVAQDVIVEELREALRGIEQKHDVVIVLREVDVFDSEYVRKNGIPEMQENT